MADKDNENLEATTTEIVDENETVSDNPSSEDAPMEATDSSEPSSEEPTTEEISPERSLQLSVLQKKAH